MFTSLKMAAGVLIIISGSAHAGWFSENVDLKKFPQAVVTGGEFTASPAPRLKEATFSDKVVFINAVNSSVVEEKLSYIKSSGSNSENSGDEEKPASLKSGKRISKRSSEDHVQPLVLEPFGTNTSTLGGLFTLGIVNNEVSTQTFKTKAESRAVKEVKGIDGVLFPLKVGNALFFSYSFLNEAEKYGITFEVKKKTPIQSFIKEHAEIKDLNLIGDIYVISRETKSSNDRVAAESCDLYYSDEISYVIGGNCPDKRQWIKSYKLNQPGESYREEVAALNKENERKEIEVKMHTSEQLTPESKAKAKDKFSQAFKLFQEGEFEAAVIRFNQALEIDPANGLGHYYLAETYARLNDVEKSMEHYKYTVLFSPDIKEAAIAEVKLSKIKEALNKAGN